MEMTDDDNKTDDELRAGRLNLRRGYKKCWRRDNSVTHYQNTCSSKCVGGGKDRLCLLRRVLVDGAMSSHVTQPQDDRMQVHRMNVTTSKHQKHKENEMVAMVGVVTM